MAMLVMPSVLFGHISFPQLLKAVFDWLVSLVGCFGLNGPFRQYFSLYRAVPQREGERRKT